MISQQTFELTQTDLVANMARAATHAQSAHRAAFHFVAMHKTGEFERLLDSGQPGRFDVNCSLPRCNNVSLLLAAAHFGHSDVVRMLLSRGALPNVHSDTGDTPLIVACRKGFVGVVDALLWSRQRSSSSSSSADVVDLDLRVRWTALEVAAKRGVLIIVKKLLALGARTDIGAPLHAACSVANNEGVVRLLISSRAPLNERSGGKTPLECAIAHRLPATVALLLGAGADTSALTPSGQTLLMLAVKAGDANTVRAIVEHETGARDINHVDDNGNSALSLAVAARSVTMVQLLCQRGADANYRKPDGLALLYSAARQDELGLAEALLAAGARVNEQEDDGATALSTAVCSHRWMTVDLLLRNGADASLSRAVLNQPILSHATTDDRIEALIRAGAQVNAMGVDRRTPLFYAAARQDMVAVTTLLKHGADASLGDSVLGALLEPHWYVQGNLLAAVKQVMRAGASVNGVYRATGDRPIHIALRGRVDQTVLEHLIIAGADVLAAGQNGETGAALALYDSQPSWALAAQRERATDSVRVCMLRQAIRKRRLVMIRTRAVDICLALRHVSALELVAILEHDDATLREMPFGLKYSIASAVKHFVPNSSAPKIKCAVESSRVPVDVLLTNFIVKHQAMVAQRV
jgi:ankyrin repeat protein